jgi:ubiquinone biosynthesis protein Coq4
MSITLDGRDDLVEPLLRIIRSAIDIGDGGTQQQRGMLGDIARVIFGRDDISINGLAPMTPVEAGQVFDSIALRRRVRMFLILFMLCRHPLEEQQLSLVEQFVEELGGDDGDPGLAQARSMVETQMLEISDDLYRAWGSAVEAMAESSLIDEYRATETAEPALFQRVLALRDLPRGTLGREYVEFYRDNGFALPGEEPGVPAFFVGHDMCHLIAGCGPKAHEEIALGAFLLGAREDADHWAYLLGVMAIMEYGAFAPPSFTAKVGTLGRPGAMDVVLDALLRGQQCYVDLLAVDHLAMAHLPIADIRQRFNIAEPNPPFPLIVECQ